MLTLTQSSRNIKHDLRSLSLTFSRSQLMTNLLLLLLPFLLYSSSSIDAAAPHIINVGVILDFNSTVGQTCPVSLNMAVRDFYAAHPNSTTKIVLHFRDSNHDVVTAASHAVDLISNDGVTAILGPQTSLQASFIVEVGAKSQVPIISFSATSSSVSPSQSPYFVRAAISNSAAAAPIAALVQHYSWRRVVPIYEDSDFGASFIPSLVDALDSVGSQIPYRVPIPASASDDYILEQLYKLKTEQTRVFVVHVTTPLALRIFTNAKAAGMMEAGFSWITTAGITSLINSIDSPVVLDSMQGVLGVKPYSYSPRSKKLRSFRSRWRRELLKSQNPPSSDDIIDINTFVIWAYDAVFALAMAAEASHPVNSYRSKNSSSDLDLASIPTMKTGPKLLTCILNTEFEGLAGEFRLIRGELNVTAFEIVNVVGEKEHSIGYWTWKNGLRRELGVNGESGVLGPVIWPGESMEVVKGFVEPTSTMGRLKIAVPGPVQPGFQSFLNVERDAANVTVASGYVIDVFEAAVRRLPYALPFEYVAYMDKEGKSAGDYNTMVQQVSKEFDAVVGDVTITANRSKYVDFTMPYTTSGISMVVPWKDQHSRNAWLFIKPLTANLWVVSAAFFVFTGMVVWAIEHRVNEEFRGPQSHQIGTVFYFTFSTLVFSHKEQIVSNLARIVVIIWVFVVLILQSSYTANLTSMITVRQLQPTLTNFKELIDSNQNVGYLQDSFVKGFLIKQGFDPKKLKPYNSPEQYAHALSQGSKNGGVAAIVDEIPYINVFLKDYCSNYTMAGQPNKTGGFGFVFPKGSLLVEDLSRAILNLTESDEMVQIERRWFGDGSSCVTSSLVSNSLDFMSFWGLFLITGTASLICLAINTVYFFCQNKHSLNDIASGGTFKWLHSIARIYDEKDLTFHTFKRDPRYSTTADSRDHPNPPASPDSVHNNITMGSPMSISHHTFDDGTASVPELTNSPMVEILPLHIEMSPTSSL